MIQLNDRTRGHRAQGRWVIRTGHRHRVGLACGISITIVDRHNKGLRDRLVVIQRLDRSQVLDELISSARSVHLQLPVGSRLGHKPTGDNATNDSISKGVIVHIGSRQSADQAGFSDSIGLGNFGDRAAGNCCKRGGIIGSRQADDIIALHHSMITIADGHGECLCHLRAGIQRLDRGRILGK